jgi:hypothetical protein
MTRKSKPKRSRFTIVKNFKWNVWLPIIISLLGAAIASYSAWQATKSAGYAKDNVRVGLRAYLGVQTMNFGKITEGERTKVEVIIENTGRTPAMNVTLTSRLDYRDSDISDDPDYRTQPEPESKLSILSGFSHPAIVFGERGLFKNEVEDLVNQKTRFYSYGVIQYDDVFGERHTTKYCGWYNFEKTSFTSCRNHNQID